MDRRAFEQGSPRDATETHRHAQSNSQLYETDNFTCFATASKPANEKVLAFYEQRKQVHWWQTVKIKNGEKNTRTWQLNCFKTRLQSESDPFSKVTKSSGSISSRFKVLADRFQIRSRKNVLSSVNSRAWNECQGLIVANSSCWSSRWVSGIRLDHWAFRVHSLMKTNRRSIVKHARLSKPIAKSSSLFIFVKILIIVNLEKFDFGCPFFYKRLKYRPIHF